MGMDRDWRMNNRDLGAVINYTCPHLTAVSQFETQRLLCKSIKMRFLLLLCLEKSFLDQTVQCIWDKDTDEMRWYPSDVYPCDGKYRALTFI